MMGWLDVLRPQTFWERFMYILIPGLFVIGIGTLVYQWSLTSYPTPPQAHAPAQPSTQPSAHQGWSETNEPEKNGTDGARIRWNGNTRGSGDDKMPPVMPVSNTEPGASPASANDKPVSPDKSASPCPTPTPTPSTQPTRPAPDDADPLVSPAPVITETSPPGDKPDDGRDPGAGLKTTVEITAGNGVKIGQADNDGKTIVRVTTARSSISAAVPRLD